MRREEFKKWWQIPATKTERLTAALLGAWSFFLCGTILVFLIAPGGSVSGQMLLRWVIGSISLGLMFGAILPKITLIAMKPFAFISFSGGD